MQCLAPAQHALCWMLLCSVMSRIMFMMCAFVADCCKLSEEHLISRRPTVVNFLSSPCWPISTAAVIRSNYPEVAKQEEIRQKNYSSTVTVFCRVLPCLRGNQTEAHVQLCRVPTVSVSVTVYRTVFCSTLQGRSHPISYKESILYSTFAIRQIQARGPFCPFTVCPSK